MYVLSAPLFHGHRVACHARAPGGSPAFSDADGARVPASGGAASLPPAHITHVGVAVLLPAQGAPRPGCRTKPRVPAGDCARRALVPSRGIHRALSDAKLRGKWRRGGGRWEVRNALC